MKLVIDLDLIKVDEMDMFTEMDTKAEVKQREIYRDLLWRFVTDDNGVRVAESQAREFIGNSGTLTAIKAVNEIARVMASLKTEALPPNTSAT